MGTRHLICVFEGGEFKVAQYGQWDGYPSGQGARILDFLKHEYIPAKFHHNLKRCKPITSAKHKALWVACGADPKSEWVSLEVSKKFGEKHPELSRDTGAGILSLIQKGKAKWLNSDIEFAGDSLFCEWAYIIDIDNNTLEVYKGFNTEPLGEGERFKSFENYREKEQGDKKEYYPVKLVKMYSLKRLPSLKRFVAECDGKE